MKTTLPLFVESDACKGEAHCRICRNPEGPGPAFRLRVANSFTLPADAPNFECPAERGAKPWGYAGRPAPARGMGDTLSRLIDKAAALVGTTIVPCGNCNERQAMLNKLVPYPKVPGAGRTPKQFFDRVVLINLKRRPDRLEQALAQIKRSGWPFRKPEIFQAIDGGAVPLPKGWTHGAGTWGCMQSHRQVLERAIMDGVKSLLVLEDDLLLRKSFRVQITKFIAAVPEEWDQLMIGGQLFDNSEVEEVGSGIARVSNCHRTHCYGVSRNFMRILYKHWISSEGHCDHRMGEVQSQYRVYAPVPFLAGQTQSFSDINGAVNPIKFWNPPNPEAPVVVLKCNKEVAAELRPLGFHFGNTILPDGADVGLREIFGPKPIWDVERHLGNWIEMIAWEAASLEDGVCTIFHPASDVELVRRATRRKVYVLSGSSSKEILSAWRKIRKGPAEPLSEAG